MKNIKEYLNETAKVFGHKNNNKFFKYLKNISKPNKQVCNKEVKTGEGGWKCVDCELDSLSLICYNCFNKSKDIHKGHKILFNPKSHGYCDCGDPNVINKDGFCPEHKGPFSNKKDLLDYIKSSIDEKILNEIDSILNNIFILFIEKINFLINKHFKKDKEKNDIENELFNMIDEFINFITNLYKSNLGLFYFVTLKFTENYSFETNHKCFYYNEEENKITIIEENKLEKHKCICPFFQVLIYILISNKTKFNIDSFFSLFIQNYKNKIIVSLSFLHSYTKLFDDDNLSVFKGMGYQLISDHLIDLVYDEKNIFFLENFFVEVYNKLKEFINKEEYEKAEKMLYRLYEIILFLPKLNYIDKIRNNLKIINIIIDIIGLINNLNTFDNKIKFNKFQRNGYMFHILNCELFCIYISIMISLLLDFDNLETVKNIFNQIITKILEYKKNKENLSKKTFSPHIAYIRYYSVFLNRFCFNYSAKHNCDLLDSFQYFKKIIPESKDINLFLFIELINLFGFIISQKYSFFIYYGESMKGFYINYFSSKINIISDISLMKYLLTIPEIEQNFNIDKILIYSNIDSCNNFFLNLKEEDLLKETD